MNVTLGLGWPLSKQGEGWWEELQMVVVVWRNCNPALLNEDGAGTVESDLAVSQKVRELPSYDPAVPVLGLYIFKRIIGRDLNR